MRKTALSLLLVAIILTGCKQTDKPTSIPVEAQKQPTVQLPDSTLWGHLGEDTGMSTLQFITQQGDTLELYRTNPITGEDGQLMGEVRNCTDLFAITLQADGETMRTAVNATQLSQLWKTEEGSVNLKPDGSIISKKHPYDGWKLWNGHILLSSQQEQEVVGRVQRIDTLDIHWLSADSLIIHNPFTKHFFKLYNPI